MKCGANERREIACFHRGANERRRISSCGFARDSEAVIRVASIVTRMSGAKSRVFIAVRMSVEESRVVASREILRRLFVSLV